MSQFIRCTVCSENIGIWYNFFRLARAAYTQHHIAQHKHLQEADPANISLMEDSAPELRELLEAIGLTKNCCKTRMLSAAPIFDVFAMHMNADFDEKSPS